MPDWKARVSHLIPLFSLLHTSLSLSLSLARSLCTRPSLIRSVIQLCSAIITKAHSDAQSIPSVVNQASSFHVLWNIFVFFAYIIPFFKFSHLLFNVEFVYYLVLFLNFSSLSLETMLCFLRLFNEIWCFPFFFFSKLFFSINTQTSSAGVRNICNLIWYFPILCIYFFCLILVLLVLNMLACNLIKTRGHSWPSRVCVWSEFRGLLRNPRALAAREATLHLENCARLFFSFFFFF
jgi:hypothetical protein